MTLIPAWWGHAEPGSSYRPSNATEGECFHAKFCNRCQFGSSEKRVEMNNTEAQSAVWNL